MLLGVEIGGTKLQLGVGRGDGTELVALERLTVQTQDGAEGIRRQIASAARGLIERYDVRAVGIGFGGPVDAEAGRTVKSHQVEGWDDYPLVDWCRQTLGLPAALCNDADAAGLAESRFGAGRGRRIVFYITVGSGIGGALVVDGQLYRGGRGIASELGHLRPGLEADRSDRTIEGAASGFGIARAAQAWLAGQTLQSADPSGIDLRRRCGGMVESVTGRMVADAADEGNLAAAAIFGRAIQTLGWGIAQMITLLAPQVVVIGGGVPLVGESRFFVPLRREVARYVFPPLSDTFEIVAAGLGEEVVVHGALAVATSL